MAGSDYYNHGAYPSPNSIGSSQALRNELEAIETGFSKLPALGPGSASKPVAMSADGMSLVAVSQFSDNTEGNVSIAAHGLMPKLPGNSSLFFNGAGGYSSPGNPAIALSLRPTAMQITPTDTGKILLFNGSANYTQTFDLPSVLTNGFYFYAQNTGTADIELAAPGTVNTTSATSNSIAAGVTWTIGTGLAITAGDQMVARRTADGFNQRITGTVASYNSGTGAITMTPQDRVGAGTFTDWSISVGAASIDGKPSYVMYPGEARLFQCDGAVFRSIVLQSYMARSTVSGTFIKPPGYKQHRITLDGAGSSGGSGAGGGTGAPSATAYGGGGGGGGASGNPGKRVARIYLDSELPSSAAYLIGAGGASVAGGAGGIANASAGIVGNHGLIGLPGGASSFGQVSDLHYLSASGGPIHHLAVAASRGQGGQGVSGVAGEGGGEYTEPGTFSVTFDQKITFPTQGPVNGAIGVDGVNGGGQGGNGGDGGRVRASSALLSTPAAAASGGAAQANPAVVGNAGQKGADGGVAQGGGGGGGGSGSKATPGLPGNGGAGGASGKGGDGQFMAEGVS